ncbi:hypothetical protein BDN72DRAFT_851470 [Pluteus cervinus]|uniref:Uncharacterized protein n=1 Tax=Pluteus cervinus TaxID=181527 RepID=A0ACD3A047_9AGAR|nr:hypothetical protein BDN72DRAFT_851470 [Pluteus cervinus]
MKFDTTLGALLIGGLLAMALWGVTCVQTYNYFTRGSRDRPAFKLMIGFLLALDTFDSTLNGHILYYYMVSHYLDPFALLSPTWSIIIHVAVTSISNWIVRSMFARRVWRLSNKNIVLTTWIMAISTADLVVGLFITVKAFGIQSFPDLSKISHIMYLNFAVSTVSDISLSLALCYLLRRSRTGFPKTDSILRILMLYTVNTGLLVAIDETVGLITYVTMPDNLIFLGFYLLLSKLYLNSYLAMLNARDKLRDRLDAHDPVSIHLSQMTPAPSSRQRYSYPASDLTLDKHEPSSSAITVDSLRVQDSRRASGHYGEQPLV